VVNESDSEAAGRRRKAASIAKPETCKLAAKFSDRHHLHRPRHQARRCCIVTPKPHMMLQKLFRSTGGPASFFFFCTRTNARTGMGMGMGMGKGSAFEAWMRCAKQL